MKRLARLVASVLGLLTLFCMDMEAKKPAFRNSVWVSEQQSFVADVGTMTETFRLEFGPGKEVVVRESWSLPAHPATYVNPDGTVDMLPGRSSESSSAGRWRYCFGKLTVTLEDGSKNVYHYRDGTLVQTDPTGTVREYRKL